jgi:superfamily I DNA and/or RNA helicase
LWVWEDEFGVDLKEKEELNKEQKKERNKKREKRKKKKEKNKNRKKERKINENERRECEKKGPAICAHARCPHLLWVVFSF